MCRRTVNGFASMSKSDVAKLSANERDSESDEWNFEFLISVVDGLHDKQGKESEQERGHQH